MVRDLLATERKYAAMTRRNGLVEELGRSIKRSYYRDRTDAIEFARAKADVLADDAHLESTDGVEHQ